MCDMCVLHATMTCKCGGLAVLTTTGHQSALKSGINFVNKRYTGDMPAILKLAVAVEKKLKKQELKLNPITETYDLHT